MSEKHSVRERREVWRERTEFMPKSAEEPPARNQSPHRSDEASNDRGAKGGRKKESEKTMEKENKPGEVPVEAKQPGEASKIPFRDELGAEPCLWTDRMLAALQAGVKGKKWFSLHDKTGQMPVLRRAWEKVRKKKGGGGVDRVEISHFREHEESELQKLSEQLREGRYQPAPVKRVWIEKMGSKEKRPIGIPTVRDRVVQNALQMTLGPIFEIGFHPHSYGFRPWRGCKDALRKVDQALKAGKEWVVEVDVKGYFDNINHEKLMEEIEAKISDGATLGLIRKFLQQGVMDSHQGWQPTEKGTPQGAVVSPLLSNIYLNELDWEINRRGEGCEMIRYADDFVVLSHSQEEAEQALERIRVWMAKRKLELHPTKTRIVHHQDKEGFEFLGYWFKAGQRYPRKKSVEKIRDKIRGQTSRLTGRSITKIIEGLNPMLKGWYGYFKHSHHQAISSVDSFVRRRLRAILARRRGKNRHANPNAHKRWPNSYFASEGLVSLMSLHREARQSR